ncbi:SRPBCC domain-containing protein [Virgisporangium ochraceum]|uniref:ATPase n=1 Tax=Virgisporangium ochraceum TaxID=65505 RepID=A0A8J4A6V2_9ACTN|nr:SRPBCC domain-containing protein [Virgisporangium ochraceum]GIJ74955.1 ATPase [Virgisporangium ochraceum]
MRRDLTVETDLPHPVDQVWAALTDPAALAEWVMPVEGFAPAPGTTFRFRAKPMPGWDGVIDCEVLEVEPPHRMVLRWQGSRMRSPTTLTWRLTAIPEGTRFRIDHQGFSGPAGVISALMHRGGWRRMAANRLPSYLGVRR